MGKHSLHSSSSSVYACGYNVHGECGNHGFDIIPAPKLVHTKVPLSEVSQVFCGQDHTVALTAYGDMYGWGHVGCGRLGIENEQHDFGEPTLLITNSSVKFSVIACGDLHTLAITTNGVCFAWGNNVHGELGLGDKLCRNTPSKVEGLPPATEVAATRSSSLVISGIGELFTWGSNQFGCIGISNEEVTNVLSPRKVNLNERIKKAACGAFHVAAITLKGVLLTWGRGDEGQLGHQDKNNLYTPEPVDALLKKEVRAVDCGVAHTAIIVYDENIKKGVLFTCGLASNGQLGLCRHEDFVSGKFLGKPGPETSNILTVNIPMPVTSLLSHNVEQVACGDFHTACLSEGLVFMWGDNSFGQLGFGKTSDSFFEPSRMENFRKGEVVNIALGGRHSCFLSKKIKGKSKEHTTCMSCSIYQCKNCGGTFCQKCAAYKKSIGALGIALPVRVCRACFECENNENPTTD